MIYRHYGTYLERIVAAGLVIGAMSVVSPQAQETAAVPTSDLAKTACVEIIEAFEKTKKPAEELQSRYIECKLIESTIPPHSIPNPVVRYPGPEDSLFAIMPASPLFGLDLRV